jgi:hypothetical protein
MRCSHLALVFLVAFCVAAPVRAQNPWERLPPTPVLPELERGRTAPVNGIHLWYVVFGHGDPVVLIHGGLANSNYWGLQVTALSKH